MPVDHGSGSASGGIEPNGHVDPVTERRGAALPESDANAEGGGALARELSEHGHRFRVEARGGLAILTSADPAEVAAIDPALRGWLVEAARRAGFTHVAVEIPDDPARNPRETLPRHQSP